MLRCSSLAGMRSQNSYNVLFHLIIIDDGGYSDWGSWSQCSETCGDGRRSRSRSCTSPPPSPGGKDCSQLGPEKQNEDCNEGGCPGILMKLFISYANKRNIDQEEKERLSYSLHVHYVA